MRSGELTFGKEHCVTTLLLVRHATTAATGRRLGGWTPGVDLDDNGRQQAQTLADHLADAPIAAVYASPLERTVQTAQAIARRHKLRVRTRKDIGEVDYGDWTNQPLGQLRRRKAWASIQATPSRFQFPDGESLRAAQSRIVTATEMLARSHPTSMIVAVSHADIIKAAVAHHVGMPLDTFQRLVVDPASITVLELPQTGPAVLRAMNLPAEGWQCSPTI